MQNDMRDRLVELIKQGANGHTLMPTDSIADHLIANNVVVLPCRVKQILYMVTLEGKIIEITVRNVSAKFEHLDTLYDIWGTYMVDDRKYVIAILPHKIGKTVFLTKDQAEQKLKELNNKND